MADEFQTWAIVEVMGHNWYAGFVSAELIAGAPMLRVDVPATEKLAAFTKYIAPHAIYALSPCTEETARARANGTHKTPFESWSVEQQIMAKLREQGLLIEEKQLVNHAAEDMDWDSPDDE